MRKSNSDRPSPTNPTPAARIKACCYMRVGTAKTDTDISIEVQRERLLSLAEQAGYEITYWYVDQRCSGSKPLKRHEWHKLLSDAATAEWEVVLCLNRERFNRLDHIEQGMVLQKLQKTGKKLHTAVEGPLDWDATAGEIIDKMIDAEEGVTPPIVVDGKEQGSTTPNMGFMDAINTEMAHSESAQRARRSLEGQLRAFQEGKGRFGTCPYGYTCHITDPQGNIDRITRKPNFSVPKGWSKILVPNQSKEPKVVRWLFETFASMDVTFRSLAQELNDKGVPAPQGGDWSASTVVQLLANDTYVGDTRFGRRGTGKFYRLEGDKVVKVERGTPNEQHEGVVRKDTHEGIISREVWDRVQAKLNRRGTAGALVGIMMCGHCNQRMYAHRRKGKNASVAVRYGCRTAMRGTGTCSAWSVREDDILPLVIDKLASEHGVSVTAENCREILQRHRCQVACWWKPDSRPRRWIIDRVSVQFDTDNRTVT